MKIFFILFNNYISSPINCIDYDNRCNQWAIRGECLINPDYMLIGIWLYNLV